MKRGENKIPQRYFLPFCTRKLSSHSVETIFVLTFHISPLAGRSAGKRRRSADNGGTGTACLGLGSDSRQGSLQVTLNVGDWGDHAKWPRPSQGPLKPKMESATKVAPEGLGEDQPRSCKSRKAEGTGPALGTNNCVSVEQCCSASASGFKSELSLAWRHRGPRNCSEISYELAEKEHLRKAQLLRSERMGSGLPSDPQWGDPLVPMFSHRQEHLLFHLQGPPSSGSEERGFWCAYLPTNFQQCTS